MNKTLQTKIAVNDLYDHYDAVLEPSLWLSGVLKDFLPY